MSEEIKKEVVADRKPAGGKRRKFDRRRRGDDTPRGFMPGNDVTWWTKVPELMTNASNLKSNWIAGEMIDVSDIRFGVPGVMTAHYIPNYGFSTSATDPLNVWARDFYLKMFQRWRGITQYEYPDLGITIIAQLEIIRMIAKLERIYGVVSRYSKANVNMPTVEAAGLGLTATQADFIRGHLSDYRYDLNELIRKAQRLCIPKDMSVIADQLSLLGYEYLDHDNPKAQIIIFDSNEFGFYDETTLSTGGSVKFSTIDMNSTPKLIEVTGSSDNMFPALTQMLDAFLGSTSTQKILGDLLTWFGNEQLLVIEALPDNYLVAPVYSESILHKLHNVETIYNGAAALDARNAYPTLLSSADITQIKGHAGYWVYQYDNNIVSARCFCTSGSSDWIANTAMGITLKGGGSLPTQIKYDHNSFIDSYRTDVNEETVIEGTLWKLPLRMFSAIGGGNVTYYSLYPLGTGFEIFTYFNLHTLLVNGTVSSTFISTNSSNSATSFQTAGQLAVIDWAPLSYYIDAANGQLLGAQGDIDTPIPLPLNAAAKILKAAIYSGLHTDVKVIDKLHN